MNNKIVSIKTDKNMRVVNVVQIGNVTETFCLG